MAKDAEILDTLVALQKIDSQVLAIEHEKEKILSEAAELKKKVDELKAEFSAKKSKLDDVRKKMGLCDIDIKSKEAEIKKKEEQGAQVKTNEAYKAMQNEVNLLKKEINEKEDEKLALMEEEEETNKWLKSQEGELKKAEADIQVKITVVNKTAAAKDEEIAKVNSGRAETAAKVDKLWLERYEKIRKAKRGLAVAEIILDESRNGVCSGCKMSVTAHVVIGVSKRDKINVCENCARIWYVAQ